MGFVIRTAFWFSLVLLVLPLDPADGDTQDSVGPLQALVAAREAINDVAGLCERKPDVCTTGRAAIRTIGTRAKEGARLAIGMVEEDGSTAGTDPAATGSIAPQ